MCILKYMRVLKLNAMLNYKNALKLKHINIRLSEINLSIYKNTEPNSCCNNVTPRLRSRLLSFLLSEPVNRE